MNLDSWLYTHRYSARIHRNVERERESLLFLCLCVVEISLPTVKNFFGLSNWDAPGEEFDHVACLYIHRASSAPDLSPTQRRREEKRRRDSERDLSLRLST